MRDTTENPSQALSWSFTVQTSRTIPSTVPVNLSSLPPDHSTSPYSIYFLLAAFVDSNVPCHTERGRCDIIWKVRLWLNFKSVETMMGVRPPMPYLHLQLPASGVSLPIPRSSLSSLLRHSSTICVLVDIGRSMKLPGSALGALPDLAGHRWGPLGANKIIDSGFELTE